MTADELKLFLSKEQHITVTSQQAKELIIKHEASTAKEEEVLTIAGKLE